MIASPVRLAVGVALVSVVSVVSVAMVFLHLRDQPGPERCDWFLTELRRPRPPSNPVAVTDDEVCWLTAQRVWREDRGDLAVSAVVAAAAGALAASAIRLRRGPSRRTPPARLS